MIIAHHAVDWGEQAAKYGCPRRRDETLDEVEALLRQQFPLIEPELGVITETYTLVRYSGLPPDEYEVARMRDVWRELESKWRV